MIQNESILLELKLSNGLHQKLYCKSIKLGSYLAKNHVATPTHVGGVNGFAVKTLGFCIKEHYHHHGPFHIALN